MLMIFIFVDRSPFRISISWESSIAGSGCPELL
jgi:hypothetical protein